MTVESWTLATATATERAALDLAAGAKVWRLSRSRLHGGEPMLREVLSLPSDRFSGFEELKEIPNNVYRLYSERWGITITAAAEKLKAVLADAEDARVLGCPSGTPLLEIARTAYDINKRPVEYRVSRCLTEKMHYASNLS